MRGRVRACLHMRVQRRITIELECLFTAGLDSDKRVHVPWWRTGAGAEGRPGMLSDAIAQSAAAG